MQIPNNSELNCFDQKINISNLSNISINNHSNQNEINQKDIKINQDQEKKCRLNINQSKIPSQTPK